LPRIAERILEVLLCIHGKGRRAPHAKTPDSVPPTLLIRLKQPFEARPAPGAVEHIARPAEAHAVVHDHVAAVGIGRPKTHVGRGVCAGSTSDEKENCESSDHGC
jgi:hypothetical protein